MNALSKIKLTSGIAIVSLLAFLTYNAYLFATGAGFTMNDGVKADSQALTQVTAFIGVELLYQFIVIALLICLFFQFNNGKVFSSVNLRYSFAIGWLCLLYPAYSYGADFLLDLVFQAVNTNLSVTLHLNLIPMAQELYLVAGIIILPIAYIFKHGSALKSELEEYI